MSLSQNEVLSTQNEPLLLTPSARARRQTLTGFLRLVLRRPRRRRHPPYLPLPPSQGLQVPQLLHVRSPRGSLTRCAGAKYAVGSRHSPPARLGFTHAWARCMHGCMCYVENCHYARDILPPRPAPARKACYRPSLQKDQRGAAAVGAPEWYRRPQRSWGASKQQRARNCHCLALSSLVDPGTAPGR
eukprot:COSAG01_NODE_861_length_13035_cov_6.890449_1_plen_187_part_00